jgi:hypothetical protein
MTVHQACWRLIFFALLAAAANGQWVNTPPPGTPLKADGKPNLKAPVPRTADGKPDLTGTWMHDPTPPDELRRLYKGTMHENELEVLVPGMNIELQHKYGSDLLIDFDAKVELKPGEFPTALMRPEGIAARFEMLKQFAEFNRSPCSGAEVVGWPQLGLLSEPLKIVQSPRVTVVLYEVGNMFRQIFTDGRNFPAEFDLPAFLGFSIGHWEEDTFVVETRGFRGGTLLDVSLHPRSDEMVVTERFRRLDFGHMDMEITFNDPKYYTQPWTIHIPHTLDAGTDLLEMFCENEKDAKHMQPPPALK